MCMTMYYNLLHIFITGNYITLLLFTLFPKHYWSIKLSFHVLNIGVGVIYIYIYIYYYVT